MTLRKVKILLILLTAAACMTLPFLMAILRSIFSIKLNDTSVETFQKYKTHLAPIKDTFLFVTLSLCITASGWILYDNKRVKRIGNIELFISLIFLIVAVLIIFIKTALPTGRLI